MKENFKINFFQYLFSAIFGLSLYFLFFLPVEFLLTEVLFVVPRINPWINTSLLLFFLLMVSLFDWGKIINKRRKLMVLLIIVVVSFSFYSVYHRAKLNLEYLPKIYQVKPAWIIQGQLVEIKGVNFGPVSRIGMKIKSLPKPRFSVKKVIFFFLLRLKKERQATYCLLKLKIQII